MFPRRWEELPGPSAGGHPFAAFPFPSRQVRQSRANGCGAGRELNPSTIINTETTKNGERKMAHTGTTSPNKVMILLPEPPK